ncbi:MAG: M67 family metallopeptidase [Candidatus Acidiferrales bacterium]
MGDVIRVRRDVLIRLLDEAHREPALECCGLLAGRDGIIERVLPAPNALASPSAYEIAPGDLFRLMREIRAAELHMMGIYHSHPTGGNYPSPRDIERAYYPDGVYFIVSSGPKAQQPVRAFAICDGRVSERSVEVV